MHFFTASKFLISKLLSNAHKRKARVSKYALFQAYCVLNNSVCFILKSKYYFPEVSKANFVAGNYKE